MNVLTSVGDIEFEIQTILSSFGPELNSVQALKEFCTGKTFSLSQQQSICEFFIRSRAPDELIRFLIAQRNLRNPVLWKYFAFALRDLAPRLDIAHKVDFNELIRGCYHSAEENKTDRHSLLPFVDPETENELLQQMKQDWLDYRESVRAQLLQASETYRSQGLDEQQEEIIQKWMKTFPDDEAPKTFAKGLQEQKAIATLEKRIGRWKKTWSEKPEEPLPQELKHEMLQHLKLYPESRYDVALAAVFMNEYLLAAEILKNSKHIFKKSLRSELWLLLECLNKAGLNVELLDLIERFRAESADETAARIFYQARAMNGLDKKKEAIELMESLLKSFPDYPQAENLLNDWKDNQF